MKIESRLAAELERIRDEAEQGFAHDAASRRVLIRKLSCIARTWYTKPFRQGGEMLPTFQIKPEDRRAFRRAFIEVMLQPVPIQCIDHPDGTSEFYCPAHSRPDKKNARLDPRGRVIEPDSQTTWAPSVSLAPKAILSFVDAAEYRRNEMMRARFSELTGGKVLPHAGKVFSVTQRRDFRKMAIGAVKRFSARLDPAALRIVRRLVLNEPGLVTRLAHPDDRIALRWQQAMDAYPALVLDAWRHRESTALEAAIENGQPLVPELARLHRTSEAVIRRYQGVLPQTISRTLAGQREYFDRLSLVGELPQHLRPRTQTENHLVGRLLSDAGVRGPGQVTALVRGMKRSLKADVRLDDLAGYRDVRESLSRAMQPGIVRPEEVDTPLDMLSLGARIRLNRDWHRAVRDATIEASKLDAGNTRSWPGLLLEPVDLGELVATELTTSAELVAEGIAMGHCVGGYTWNCMHGISRIVSLRTREGDSVTTMEICRSAKGGYVLRQNYTFGNRPAPKVAVEAAKKLMSMLRRKTVAVQGPWPQLPCEANDRSGMEKVVNETLHQFWRQRYPHLVPSLEERARILLRQKEEADAERDEWNARRQANPPQPVRDLVDADPFGEYDIAF